MSFVTRTLRQDSSSSASIGRGDAAFGRGDGIFGRGDVAFGRGDGIFTPEDSDLESGDDERTIVEAEKADGLFQGLDSIPITTY